MVNDGDKNSTSTYDVNVTAVNDAPVIHSLSSINVIENTINVIDVNATDVEADTITYSITGGDDNASFDINSSTGALSFKVAPDFETPVDIDTNNTYIVEVTATDDSANMLSDVQTITITVTDEFEPGVLQNATLTLGDYTVDANTTYTFNYTTQTEIPTQTSGSANAILYVNLPTGFSGSHTPNSTSPNEVPCSDVVESITINSSAVACHKVRSWSATLFYISVDQVVAAGSEVEITLKNINNRSTVGTVSMTTVYPSNAWGHPFDTWPGGSLSWTITADNDIDADGDGYTIIAGGDCNDANAAINPGATEIPNNAIDEDCSGADLIAVTSHIITTDGVDTTAYFDTSLSATTIPIVNGGVETTATVNNVVIDVVANADGTAKHRVKPAGIAETVATFNLPGAQTNVDDEGNVESTVATKNYVDPNGCTVKVAVKTMNTGESLTRYIVTCPNVADKIQNTTDESTPFEAGNIIEVYENNNSIPIIQVDANVTRKIVF